ncbi:MAG: YARHG domain-containing protein [Chitinophagaceae bacterium]
MRFYLIFFVLLSVEAFANDGAFYAAGNQLIPIHETSVSVKKEILSMKKMNNEYVDVTVYYEFFNPGPEKTITVGFEAGTPLGDVDGTPRNGQHPYIYDFTVMMNGGFLKYDIAYVNDSLYEEKGVVKSRKLEEVLKSIDNENAIDFGYVYHFKARFKAGLNVVRHTYRYKVSNSIETLYDVEYVLTAAKRWGNRQIDDFTLILDMGNFESFNLEKSFFADKKDWLLTGIGKCTDTLLTMPRIETGKLLRFHIRNGMAVFQKKNFKPMGELRLYAERFIVEGRDKNYLNFSIDYYREGYDETADPFLRKVYRNLPFARRGYIFQSADLQSFFDKMDWYMPDPNYQPDVEMLDDREKKWILRWK